MGALIGIVGAISYAPLMVARQFAGKQFIPSTRELEQLEFSYEIVEVKEIDMAIWEKENRIRVVLQKYRLEVLWLHNNR